MITVHCKDVKAIRNELAVYVSDQIEAVPTLKTSEFVLSPVDDEPIDKDVAVTAIREYLDSIGEARNFEVIPIENDIYIKATSGKVIKPESRPNQGMFACPHCGFLTQYEEEHYIHMRIHYL